MKKNIGIMLLTTAALYLLGGSLAMAAKPSTPTGVNASDGWANLVHVTWNKNPEPDVIKYAVYRNIENSWSDLLTPYAYTNGTSYDDVGATPGNTYTYWVKAINSNNETSNVSGGDSGHCVAAPPSTPTGVKASKNDPDKIQVTWNKNPELYALTYEVWRSLTPSSAKATKVYETIGLEIEGGRCYEDKDVTADQTYYYWLKAHNNYGTSGFSEMDSGYLKPPPPPAPAGVNASDGTYLDKIRITWQPVIGAGPVSYEVWRSLTDSPAAATMIRELFGTAYEDTNVTAGVTNYYWIKTKNSSGTSDFSTVNSGFRKARKPSAPAGVSASQGTCAGFVRVWWTPLPNGTAEKYEVWRSLTPSSKSATNICETGDAKYNDAGVTAGKRYYYWIKAKNSAGTSGFSEMASGYPGGQPVPPPPPTDVKASNNDPTMIQVTWEPAAGSEFGKRYLYEVWRAEKPSFYAATRVTRTGATLYDDMYDGIKVRRLKKYYYWIKTWERNEGSYFSEMAVGYCPQKQLPPNMPWPPPIRPTVTSPSSEQSSPVGAAVTPSISVATITEAAEQSAGVVINLDTASNEPADWWIVAETPMGWFRFDAVEENWTACDPDEPQPSYQGNLYQFPEVYEVLSLSAIALPAGRYVFYFAVDTPLNGKLDEDNLWMDSITVAILPDGLITIEK